MNLWKRLNSIKYTKSIKEKTVRFFVFLLGFFSVVIMASFAIIIHTISADYSARASETAVNNVVSNINATIQNYNYISRLIMVNESVVSFLHSETANPNNSYEARMGMYEILNQHGRINYIDSVYVFRCDGAYANTGKGEYVINREADEWERIMSAKGARVLSIDGNGIILKTDGVPSLTFARAIYDIYTQELLGVLFMNISNSCFDEVISLQEVSGMCITDDTGTFLCGDETIGSFFDESCVSNEMIYKNKRLNGKLGMFTAKQTKDSLVVMCYAGTSAQPMPGVIVFAMLMTFCALYFTIISYNLFVRKNITMPILTLNDAIERTKSEGWLRRIEEEMPDDEIGRLAASYNRMIDYMNELFSRLLQEEEDIRMSEMKVLYEQIKPHFLYNTLETISYLAMQEQAERTQDALETLGSFYRLFLSKGNKEITLENEIRITQDYLSLQKFRYEDIFTDEYDIDETAQDFMVPKLILQPLVENCIYHGIKPKGEKCIIKITTRMQEDGLHISVYDAGVGMDSKQIEKVQAIERTGENRDHGGFGLGGTINRIRYYCKRDDVVNIRSEKGEYTEIELIFPMESRKDRYGSEIKNVQSNDY